MTETRKSLRHLGTIKHTQRHQPIANSFYSCTYPVWLSPDAGLYSAASGLNHTRYVGKI